MSAEERTGHSSSRRIAVIVIAVAAVVIVALVGWELLTRQEPGIPEEVVPTPVAAQPTATPEAGTVERRWRGSRSPAPIP